jgi:uncharacterized protein YndB with AHSA1/START domain
MSLTLKLDFQFKTTIERLWTALTDSEQLSRWVANIHTGEPMENNFRPVVGHRFQFRTTPAGPWNGIIEGEVLVVEEPHRLSYTWESGEKHTITWTLTDLGNGMVNLHLEQTGISNEPALNGARYGWSKWCGDLKHLLEQ